MNRDFTRKKYRELLVSLQTAGYEFITFAMYCSGDIPSRFAILRHDVDLLPYHSLATASIEHELGIEASYYFRAIPESWNTEVIREIASFKHEVGYHYESLTTCKGDIRAAYEDFKKNLENLRRLAPVKTICMHGSPRSPYDSKDIWKHFSYHDLGLIGEPYFDTRFSDVFYLTDTGRRWDGYKVSVRDRIPTYQEQWTARGYIYRHTDDIIHAIKNETLPGRVMITTHPQRWDDKWRGWLKELVMQNVKNIVKGLLVKNREQ